jgi:hypothetical protein
MALRTFVGGKYDIDVGGRPPGFRCHPMAGYGARGVVS